MPESHSFGFEGSGLEDMARHMRDAAVQLRAEVDKTVAEIAEEIKDEAAEVAGRHSTSIPSTLRTVMMPGKAIVRAGNSAVPIAALYEMGNKGTHDTARVTGVTLRHPVFGNDVWVSQRRYPFIRPVVDANRREMTKRLQVAWAEALQPLHQQ